MNKIKAMKAAGLTYEVFAVYDELRMNAKKSGAGPSRAYCSISLPEEDHKALRVAMGKGKESKWCSLEVAPGFNVWNLEEDEGRLFPSGFCSFGDNWDKSTTWLRWDRATKVWHGKFDFDGNYEPLEGGYDEALATARTFFTG